MPQRPEDQIKDSHELKPDTSSDSTLLHEFWQSAKYTTVQKPYDGISQVINHLGGNIASRNLVDAPEVREVGSAAWIAQQAGAGLATLGGVMLLHKGMSFAGAIGTRTASSLALSESSAVGRSVGSLTAAGGLYEGLVNKSGDNFWRDRASNTAVGATSLYMMAKSQIGLNAVRGVEDVIASSKGLSGMLGKHLINGSSGFIAGAASGAFSAEAGSLLKHGKFATTSELAEKTLSSAVFGGVLGSVSKPFESVTQRTGGLPGMKAEAVSQALPRARDTSPDLSLLAAKPVESVSNGIKLRGAVPDGIPLAIELPVVKTNPMQALPQKIVDTKAGK